MSKPKILIVEDERALTEVLVYNLHRDGFETVSAADGREAIRLARLHVPDLVLLDVMLPSMSGLDVCRELKKDAATRDVPIIMLTSKAEESDQLVGFATGADDYVTKPFSVKVLIQRIRKELRKRTAGEEAVSGAMIKSGGVVIDRTKHRVYYRDEELLLTPTEYRLLETMLRQPGRAFTRNDLMNAAIGENTVVLDRTIDVHVKSLRKKMGDEGGSLIETVRGVGYRLREPSSDDA